MDLSPMCLMPVTKLPYKCVHKDTENVLGTIIVFHTVLLLIQTKRITAMGTHAYKIN